MVTENIYMRCYACTCTSPTSAWSHSQVTPRFYLTAVEKNQEKACYHCSTTDWKWWTQFRNDDHTICGQDKPGQAIKYTLTHFANGYGLHKYQMTNKWYTDISGKRKEAQSQSYMYIHVQIYITCACLQLVLPSVSSSLMIVIWVQTLVWHEMRHLPSACCFPSLFQSTYLPLMSTHRLFTT